MYKPEYIKSVEYLTNRKKIDKIKKRKKLGNIKIENCEPVRVKVVNVEPSKSMTKTGSTTVNVGGESTVFHSVPTAPKVLGKEFGD